MKSTRRVCLVSAAFIAAGAITASAQEMPAAYKDVLTTLGRPGDFKDNVLKVNIPRNDLVATFATGIQGVNFLSDGQPHEMIRLNTSIPATPAVQQNNLGVLGGDNAGFPNGRRPGDDVVDIELRVAMCALCHALPGVFCTPAQAPSGNLLYTDQVLQDPTQFDAIFPYLRAPLPGSPNGPNGVGQLP